MKIAQFSKLIKIGFCKIANFENCNFGKLPILIYFENCNFGNWQFWKMAILENGNFGKLQFWKIGNFGNFENR